MFNKRAVRGWRQMLANQGWGPTLKTARERIGRRFRPQPPPPPSTETWQTTSIHPFDVEHGTDTSGLIWGEDLPTGNSNDSWNTAYYGIAPSVFHRVIRQIPEDLHPYTFVDFGSGKGRALMLATHYPFAEVIGVEITPSLHTIAQANLARYAPATRVCSNAHAMLGDATTFAYPPTPLLLYMNHPFCRPVLEEVIAHLGSELKQRPRPLWLVYINPETRAVLDQTPFLQLAWEGVLGMDAEDRLADRMGSSQEEVTIYRGR